MDRLYCRSPKEFAEIFVGPVALGYRLRGARLCMGYTQDEVAHCLNVHKTTISNWELGKRTIDAISFARLCEVLDMDMYDALVKEVGELIAEERGVAA